jgi:hypothetical protein
VVTRPVEGLGQGEIVVHHVLSEAERCQDRVVQPGEEVAVVSQKPSGDKAGSSDEVPSLIWTA